MSEKKEKVTQATLEESKKSKEIKKAEKYTKGFFKGFKNFITKGNVLDMAVGVVMGTAFTAIINALVNGIILQFISLLTGNVSFTDIVWSIPNGQTQVVIDPVSGLEKVVELTTDIMFGVFIQAVINFIIIAFVIYLVVYILIKKQLKKDIMEKEAAEQKAIADAAAKEAAQNAPVIVPEDIKLLTEIRDLLKKQ